MILYEIIYEKEGKLYTTHAHTDHSWYCDIEESELREMDESDINTLIERLNTQLNDAPLLLQEVKQLREDIISILGAIDLPDYDEFPNTQECLRNMMTKYGQEHLIHEGDEE